MAKVNAVDWILSVVPIRIDVPLGNRENITLWNNDDAITIRVGPDSAQCVIRIPPRGFLELDWPPDVPLWAKGESGTPSITITEATKWPFDKR